MYANTDVKAIGRQYEKSTQAYREEKKKKRHILMLILIDTLSSSLQRWKKTKST